uniref:ATP synthase F0 subunit 8 n=1 Tax=Trinectes inscriptus TaxID=722570 RepID=UPI0028FCE539|nr:ATP synthase F0 subunit 8 [Trinectes inscriptus]WNH37695.1 ATP synthase F0 subunit 8 [Trinectes inscriptus]
MPQLNPSPWLMLFLMTWLIFLSLLPMKIMNHTFPNLPNPKPAQNQKTTPFNWPWH